MKTRWKRFWAFLPAAVYYGLIFYISSKSRDLPFPLPVRHSDKILHMMEFAVLGGLLAFGFSRIPKMGSRRRAAAACFTGVILAALDEIHQMFVPGRQADVWDFIADAAGIALGIGLYKLSVRRNL